MQFIRILPVLEVYFEYFLEGESKGKCPYRSVEIDSDMDSVIDCVRSMEMEIHIRTLLTHLQQNIPVVNAKISVFLRIPQYFELYFESVVFVIDFQVFPHPIFRLLRHSTQSQPSLQLSIEHIIHHQ